MTNRRDFLKSAAAVAALPLAGAGASPRGEAFGKPLVVSTWDSGLRANAAAWKVLNAKGTALDAVEQAARSAEAESNCCVGLDALPDRDGFVTLDASIMDHKANCGSVVFVRGIKHPISVARMLMEKTRHVLLAGEGATRFAVANGFERLPDRLSPESEKAWKEWLKDSKYQPVVNIENRKASSNDSHAPAQLAAGALNHDTMGTIALDSAGNLSGACTTSGLAFKMHGRVGDSPIIGAGLFVDNAVGAATATGVGEEVIRICGTHLIIELMRMGQSPEKACREAVRRIAERNGPGAKDIQVGFIAISKKGEVGAFSVQKGFTYSVTAGGVNKVVNAASHFA
jgi:N4-(beta-N-acetylglucosaminyl)-L-asparaginase